MSNYTRRQPSSVEAIRLIHPVTLDTPSGPVHGDAGDYLVTEGSRQYIVPRAEFERDYQEQSNIAITPVVQPTYVPYPIYVQPRPYWQQPTWTVPTITITTDQTTHPLITNPFITSSAINQGAVNAQLMSGMSSVGD